MTQYPRVPDHAPAARLDTDEVESAIRKILDRKPETFKQCLLRLIDARGLKDSQIYGKVNMNRQVFHRVINDPKYHPHKEIAASFVIALELDMQEAEKLMAKAGYTLSSPDKFDIIFSYFIRKRIYDIRTINPILFSYDQKQLGSVAREDRRRKKKK